MIHKITVYGRMNGQNEFIDANRRNVHIGNKMKADGMTAVMWAAKRDKIKPIDCMVDLDVLFFEPNMRRDKDNIASTIIKFGQDALVKMGILKNDGWKEIGRTTYDGRVDHDNPRIEITLTEVSKEERKERYGW